MNSKEESFDEPFGEGVKSGFEMMQHLINEMDKSSQRIDEFNTDEFGAAARSSPSEKHRIDLLYDEAWKSEDSDAASLKEIPVDFFDKAVGDSGCEDAVTSAIAEVSKDFLAGLRACTTRNQNGDSDESHLSSDTDFKLIKGMPAYARYPETTTGLSDTDWNPYGTESDTNVSPRIPSQETPGSKASNSKLAAMISFNPPLHSTDLEAVTPSFAIGSIPNTCTRKQGLHDISEQDKFVSWKPDVTADFSSISHVSDQTFNSHKAPQQPVKLSDLNKTMRGNELEDFGKSNRDMDVHKPQREPVDKHSSSAATSTNLSEFKTLKGSYISVMDRAKMIGVPEDIIDGKANVLDNLQDSKVSKQVDACNPRPQALEQGDTSDDDLLGQKVKKVLQETKYLEGDQSSKRTINEVAIDYRSLQKDLQEIQESLNQNLGPGPISSVATNEFEKNVSKSTPPSSDNDGDIIPSTTTTPDRKKNRMAWDFVGDLASGQIGNQMEEVSLNTFRNSSSSQRPSSGKQSYNSDGDETRTSGSSDKMDDHAAADQALAEMSAVLRPHRQLLVTATESGTANGISSAQDVDEMLSNFRDQRRELESRYQQLSNPGLADKVFRILTNQDPEAQADGILSQVNAQEREERARYAYSLHNNYNLNFSTDTDNMNTTNQSFSLPDDVRRRLDLSGLSSADASKVADKSSFVLPSTKGFAAFDGMTKFLSSQMEKVSEKTFNHSLEMRIPPQVATCYPLFADHKGKDQEKGEERGVAGVPSANEQQTENLFSGLPEEEPTATSSPVEAFTGSDDAKGPTLPSSALGSRKDPPPSGGIYAKHKALGSLPEAASLPPIQEKSILDDRESESNQSSKGSKNSERKEGSGKESVSRTEENLRDKQEQLVGEVTSEADDEIQVGAGTYGAASVYSRGVAAARRDAQWDNRLREQSEDSLTHKPLKNKEDAATKLKEISDFSGIGAYSRRMRENESETLQQSQSLSRDVGVGEPVSLKVKMTYTDHPEDKQAYESRERGERFIKEGREWQNLREGSRSLDHGRERAREREESKGYQVELSRPYPSSYFDREDDSHITEKTSTAPWRRNWDHDASSSPVRDARLSPAFHQALSAELRQAIEARSPLLSQHIERSLAQAPLTTSSSRWQENDREEHFRRRSASPPPTFLARERGQPLREYAHSPVTISQRSPPRSQAWREHRVRSPLHESNDRGVPQQLDQILLSRSPPPVILNSRSRSPPPVNLNSRSRSPPTLNEKNQVEFVPTSSYHKDSRTRSLSPSYKDLSQAEGPRSPSPTAEQRHQTKPVGFSNPSLRISVKSPCELQPTPGTKGTISPQRLQERTLENMTSESENTDIDREPLSRRAQMLTAALPQERDISPDINSLWDRFRALNESHDSSMDSSRIGAITDLLRNPSQHLIAQYLKEREEYRIERQERAEADRLRRLKEQQSLGMPQLHSSSEDDFNGGYSEVIAKKEEERIKRRAAKKKKGKPADTSKVKLNLEGERNKENIPDCLFSIPEDAGSDQAPIKTTANQKSLKNKSDTKPQHADNVIDPYMQKLREKISKQRGKIDKQTLKEFQRMEKLKKLEHLLSAKKHGQISDQTLEVQLGEMSATSTPGSNSSGENENGNSNCGTTPFSEDSTTAKDSSAEMHAWKAEKERRLKEAQVVEMERRKEFKSRQNTETREANKNTNRKDNTNYSKGKTQMSELKLLKLVNEGYLTAGEAYRLAVERAKQEEDVEESSICSYSSSEDLSLMNRPHRLYSPYARHDEFHDVKSKHVPKLKQFSPTNFAAAGSTMPFQTQNRYQRKWDKKEKYVMGDHIAQTLPEPSRPRSPENAWLRSSKGPIRTSSRSPSPHRGKSAGSRKPHNPVRQNFDQRSSSSQRPGSSPPRKHLPHHHHHQRRQHGGERYPTRQDLRHHEDGIERPASAQVKGVSWHIPINVHPSKWEEPQPAGHTNNTVGKDPGTSSTRRQQLPLPELPVSDVLQEDEEPTQARERNAHPYGDGFWYKADHPQGIPQELWQEVVSHDALASKVNHHEVDPLMDRVQYILGKETPAGADEDPTSGMTLQEAFLARKQIFISKCRERQKRIVLSRENRHLQECLRLEREAIFAEQDRPLVPNLHAHPCSENLYQPKQRIFTKTEMKALTQKRYKKLHEVVQKQEKQKTEAEQKLNRLRVRMFNKKVQRGVLRKTSMRLR
ncbi:alstrom syndrome protein 1 [Elysia marginata]|uniref:Alstrom syndrome protein 1 n=1 Tax=Elysia marginata TaxID=1093978 RepID=A0AAV4HKZ3_9GAST|nr:alstrom syndrome protein 1 [Elysia marginata]